MDSATHGATGHPRVSHIRQGPSLARKSAITFAFLGLLAILLVLPHGEMAPSGHVEEDPVMGESVFVHTDGGLRILRTFGSILGQVSVIVLAPSLLLGYRGLPLVGRLAPAARLRWHARLGKAILVLALLHTVLLVVRGDFRGWAPGLVSLVLLAGHGATGAFKARIIERWGAAWWRYAHRATAYGAILALVEHIVMASWHWGLAKHFEMTGWGH